MCKNFCGNIRQAAKGPDRQTRCKRIEFIHTQVDLLAAVLVMLFSSGALAAKLICISHQDLKGEMSVDKCLAQGMELAIMDSNGFIRILSSREIELTNKINPKAFQMPGFGLKHFRMAPKIPPLPVPPEAG